MDAPFQEIAAYMGLLVGAALHDRDIAEPADIGLYGMPIKQWRDAYLEGCKDMATGVTARVPEAIREDFKAAVLAAVTAEHERLRAAPAESK